MKISNLFTNKKLVGVLLIALINVNIVNSLYYQAIWYKGYTKRSGKAGSLANDTDAPTFVTESDYHSIGFKTYDTEANFEHRMPPTGENYFVVYKRNDDVTPKLGKMYKDNKSSYDSLAYWFPDMDGTHDLSFVAWDFSISCKGVVTYKIRFFNNDITPATPADHMFYKHLTSNNKMLYTSTGTIVSAKNSGCARFTGNLEDLLNQYISLDLGTTDCDGDTPTPACEP